LDVESARGTALPSLQCSKIRHSWVIADMPPARRGRTLRSRRAATLPPPETRDSALGPCYAASTALPGAGGADDLLHATAGIHRWTRRRGGRPFAARAQQGNRVRRIGLLMSGDENDPVYKARLSAFTQALAGLGWTDGRNVRISLGRR